MKHKVKGVIVPPVTPLNRNGEIDPGAIKDLVQFLVERGISGLFPGGSTGEGPLLSIQERYQLAEAFVESANGRIPVIVQTGAITTANALALTQHAQAIGADAAALFPPFYYKLSHEEIQCYFETIAAKTKDFPLYLYNIPSRTGNRLTHKLVMQLVERCPNIVGMKDSSGYLDILFSTSSLRNNNFNTAIGNDGQILMGFSMGIDACVSGNANVVPELVVALWQAISQGNMLLAKDLQNIVDNVRCILKDGTDLSLFKGILSHRGLSVGRVRNPLKQAPASVIESHWEKLKSLNLSLEPYTADD